VYCCDIKRCLLRLRVFGCRPLGWAHVLCVRRWLLRAELLCRVPWLCVLAMQRTRHLL
jgi:hypothetical protein